jgi:glycosyltransferase involved in cell wall biosynthesis
VSDASSNSLTLDVCRQWQQSGLNVKHLSVTPPNAVTQRTTAIQVARGQYLLLLDDDVELESECVERLIAAIQSQPGVVGAMANFSNQSWPMPTICWWLYLRCVLRMAEGSWQGRVVGPLLRFGYNWPSTENQTIDWVGAGNSVVSRSAFLEVGGFSDFFLHRCTMNEDIDLALKLRRLGTLLFCPEARMAHHHASSGRVSASVAAEDDVYNRFMVLNRTVGHSALTAFSLIMSFVFIESLSNVLGSVKRCEVGQTLKLFKGRMGGIARILIELSSSQH